MSEFDRTYDVAIVGAGPAGSSTAIRLAEAGLSVLLVEKAKYPREKLCGEFISPECLIHFKELGVMGEMLDAAGTALTKTTFYGRGGNGISIESSWFGVPGSYAMGLSRGEMDNNLLKRALSLGVDVRQEISVSGPSVGDNRVNGIRIMGHGNDEVNVQSKITLDATGRSRILAKRFEPSETRTAARFVAFKTHLRGARLADGTCEIYAYRGGYGGCNAVENGLFNLCFIATAGDTKRLESDPERVMREVVFINSRAAEALEDATIEKPWLAVPIQRFGRGDLVPANGLLTVGDAAAFIDPFTGSGMLLALESAKIASSAIIDHFRFQTDFNSLKLDYSRRYSSAFDRRLRVCSFLRYAAFVPFLAETTISALGYSTALRRTLARATRSNAERHV